jgi:hypothetical protein
MQLTKDFNTETDIKITNSVSWDSLSNELKANAKALAENLQAIRAYVGKPIIITSGYRPAAKNATVGGSKTSQHLHGEAWDFVVKGFTAKDLDELFNALVDGSVKLPHPCSQAIRETKGNSEWIHLGIKTHRWLEAQKSTIANVKATSAQKSRATKRLTHCEFLLTKDTINFELIKYKPYGDF